MCLEDIRLGRDSGAQARTVAVNNAGVGQLCPADQNRTRIILSTTDSGFRAWPASMSRISGMGLSVRADVPPVVIDVETYGRLVQDEWISFGLAAGIQAIVIEVGLDKQ